MKIRKAVSLNAKPSGRSSAYIPEMRSTLSRSSSYTSSSSLAHALLEVSSSKDSGTGLCSRRRNSV